MIRAAALVALFATVGQTASACRLALVLAMDVSSSVSAEEDRLQRQGLASALVAEEVQAAFFATGEPVALAIFEWSGRNDQQLLQDWVMIDGPETLLGVSRRIAASTRGQTRSPTALGHAIGYASALLQRGPVCDAATIDISGDGPNNEGFDAAIAYNAFPLDAVTINGLVIDAPQETVVERAPVDLTRYYRRHVIRGPGAFAEVADGFVDFARAMEVKLIRELAVRIIGALPQESVRR